MGECTFDDAGSLCLKIIAAILLFLLASSNHHADVLVSGKMASALDSQA